MKIIPKTSLVITFCLIGGITAGVAPAHEASSITPPILWDGYDQPWHRYREIQLSPFRKFSKNGKFVEKKTITKFLLVQNQKRQKAWVAEKLKYDLNQNGKIEVAEIKSVLNKRHQNQKMKKQTLFRKNLTITLQRMALFREMLPDRNRDFEITRSELVNFAKYRADQTHRSWQLEEFNKLFAIDPNKDGVLTLSEMKSIIKNTYASFDTNGDGKISTKERKPLKSFRNVSFSQKHYWRQIQRDCSLPMVGQDDLVVVVSAKKGHALSSVATGGFGGVTTTGNITIEPGKKPIYLLLLSLDNVLWNIKGEVSRISNVAVQIGAGLQGPGSGVRGVPAERVFFKDRDICFHTFLPIFKKYDEKTKQNFLFVTGRKIDRIINPKILSSIGVPSGKRGADTAKALPQEKQTNKSGHRLVFSGGLVEYKPDEVISPLPPQSYDVYPGQIGLDHLVKNQLISKIGTRTFLIQKSIKRYPAGLRGSKSVTFFLAPNVPIPKGNSGNSCVLWYGSGELVYKQEKAICP